jgi:hypothetical protein
MVLIDNKRGQHVGLAGALDPVPVLDGPAAHAFGFVLFFAGLAGTLWAQVAMGASWRIGVDEAESTELVTEGPSPWCETRSSRRWLRRF